MLQRSLLLTFLLIFTAASTAFTAQPRIEVDSSEYNFGSIEEGQKVTHVFRFSNSGDAPLNIERVRSSCGCTVPRLSAEVLAPGDVGEVEAVFDSRRFNGQVVKTIYLYTNDPLHDVVQLSLRGKVNKIIAADPPRVDFGVMKSGEKRQTEVRLANNGSEAIELGDVTVSNPAVEAELQSNVIEPESSVILNLSVVPDQEQGRLSGYVIIPTSHQSITEIRLPIFGTVSP
jgi:hypothetical protein